jgi:hypothetical protein
VADSAERLGVRFIVAGGWSLVAGGWWLATSPQPLATS